MEATNVASWEKVKDNYEIWKTLMKNYLVGNDLWDAIETPSTPRHDAHRMNAMALHIIQRSCGSKNFDEIWQFDKAQAAWNHLCVRYSDNELKAKPDIEQGVVGDDDFENKELYKYVEDGDWKKTESFISGNKVEVSRLAPDSGSVLHVAAMAGHANIVRELISTSGGKELLKKTDQRGFTALALVAHLTGNIDVARCMVDNIDDNNVRQDLLTTKKSNVEIPLLLAADKGHTEITRFLYEKTPTDELSQPDLVLLLERCIKAEIFVTRRRRLWHLAPIGSNAFCILSGCQFGLLGRIIYKIYFCTVLRVEKIFQNGGGERHINNSSGRFCICALNFLLGPVKLLGGLWGIRKLSYTHYQVQEILRHLKNMVAKLNNRQLIEASVYDAMLDAAKHGIVEFIEAMREANHELLWALDSHKRGVFSYAVLNRKQDVFQLIHTVNGRRDIIKSRKDRFGNNLLHLAGHLGPSSELSQTPGAALQMQREYKWFEAVEKIVHPKCREEKNGDDKKPHELFTETHKELVIDGEKWAKQSAKSFSIVGTLMTTILFAAAFTIPGGNDEKTGVPIFSNNMAFTVFIIADSISVFTSATSVMIFIWILTSRFAERDFRLWLPLKLLLGLVFLLFSVVSMMVAFCAALAIILKAYRAYRYLIIGAAICGSMPITVLVISQVNLIRDILKSTISPIG
eukprot:XP_014617212.1 uncharacterized protein LOC102663989 [Glycine max]